MSTINESTDNIIDEDLWDHYSGLPNPMWYQYIKENPENEEEGTIGDVDISTINKQN